MFYQTEITYLTRALKKLHLDTTQIRIDDSAQQHLSFGLEPASLQDASFERAFYEMLHRAKDRTIYKMSDALMSTYLVILLPQTEERVALVIGPYLTSEPTREQLFEAAERIKLPTAEISKLETYFGRTPVIREENLLLAMLHTLGETMWGEENAYETMDLNWELGEYSQRNMDHNPHRAEEMLERMRQMEQRYAFENELMDRVSRGMTHRAEVMISGIATGMMEQRQADPVRNIKNYGIIANTLLRKAAERGGVHPVHLDAVSAKFSSRLENVMKVTEGHELLGEMVRSYCRLVRKHATQQYSPLIQKTIAYMEADLSADLSLSHLAQVQNINASYLSGLFRRETGKTITEHVNEKRMELAAHLLRSTHLQIQTIAQHCGISDANYFSKVFKRIYLVTPKEFRESTQNYFRRKE